MHQSKEGINELAGTQSWFHASFSEIEDTRTTIFTLIKQHFFPDTEKTKFNLNKKCNVTQNSSEFRFFNAMKKCHPSRYNQVNMVITRRQSQLNSC